MFRSLEYTATFGTTGRTLAEKIDFQKGFGTITGPNEAGKSFSVEMIRWCLFGTAALRGKASEYKKMRAVLTLSIGGEDYRIERTTTNAKVLRGETEIAVGTTPVNEKIAQILGFGLDVFDVSCVANQGDLERLGAMKPTERKRMVDSVIGLGVIEDLGKFAAEEASSARKQASTLVAAVREPVVPEKPENYRPAAELKAEVETLQAAKDKLTGLRGWLSHERKEPTKPTCDVDMTADILSELAEGQQGDKQKLQELRMRLEVTPQPSPYSDEELDAMEAQAAAYERWQAKQKLIRSAPKPPFNFVQLDQMQSQLDENERFFEANRLRDKIAELEAHGRHTCPACEHNWAVEEAEISELRTRLQPLSDAVYTDVGYSMKNLADLRQQLGDWNEVEILLQRDFHGVVEVAKPALSLEQIETARRRNAYREEREEIGRQIEQLVKKLEGKPDFGAMLARRQSYERQLKDYFAEMRAFEEWLVERNAKTLEAQALATQIEPLFPLTVLLQDVKLYDHQWIIYEEQLKGYTETMQTVTELQEQAAEWEKVKTALIRLRSLVKQHLVPSLNKVASHYLTMMTGGQRQSIVVDEEFNILVDGQAISTLSGSGKAVANLALRFGLGQVLTNNVLSVFIGDEIDASMDKDRAENTASVLQTLKGRISQILLVTHKFPTADYYITVGTGNDQTRTALVG